MAKKAIPKKVMKSASARKAAKGRAAAPSPKRGKTGNDVAKPWTAAEVMQAFGRFAAANPHPKGELEHVNAYTLLVAVVLSAQATDAGVNKATRALFAIADTPQKMLALGEERVRDAIDMRIGQLLREKY